MQRSGIDDQLHSPTGQDHYVGDVLFFFLTYLIRKTTAHCRIYAKKRSVIDDQLHPPLRQNHYVKIINQSALA